MIKRLIPCLLLLVLLLSACGSHPTSNDTTQQSSSGDHHEKKTKTYQSQNWPVEVPKHPKRIVSLDFPSTGRIVSLGGNLVGIEKWSKQSPVLKDHLKNIKVVSEQNLEGIIALHPDLIIGFSGMKNLDKLKKIAPTVTFTSGKLNFLQHHIEIGKLLGKEQQAKKWAEDFKQRTRDIGEKVKEKIGENTTISVIGLSDKQFYVYGDNWGRGGEILYQGMGLKMPKKVKEATQKEGYQAITPEVFPEYAGDYLILSKQPGTDNSFLKTETYKNIPAVKNGHVIEVNENIFNFNDPLSLDYELDILKKALLGK